MHRTRHQVIVVSAVVVAAVIATEWGGQGVVSCALRPRMFVVLGVWWCIPVTAEL